MKRNVAWLRYLAVCVTIATLGTLAWPILPFWKGPHYEITITALGEKSPEAQHSEVWIVGFPAGLTAGHLFASRSTRKGWEPRGEGLVSYQGQPSTVTFRGVLPEDGEFRFLRHSWSGRVQVTVNGASRVHDLYAPKSDTPVIVRLKDFPSGAEAWKVNPDFFEKVFGWTLVLAGLVVAGSFLVPRLTPSPPASPRWRASLVFGLPSLVVFLLVLAGSWPAQMSPDSVTQWRQLHNGLLSNDHPIVHTFLVGGIGALLGSPGWSILLQIVVMALAIGYFCTELTCWRINRCFVWFAAMATPLWPTTALFSTVFWKDVPFATAICILIAMTLRVVRTGGECFRERTYLAAFLVVLFLVATLRHNGLVVSTGLALLLIVCFRHSLSMNVKVAAIAGGLIAPLVWSAVVLPAMGVRGIARPYGGILPMHVLGAYLAEGAALDPATEKRLSEIMPIQVWKDGYNCGSVVPLFWAPGIHYDKLDSSLFKPALAAILADPMPAIRHQLCVNSLNWRISQLPASTGVLVPLGVWPDPEPNPWNAKASPIPVFKDALDKIFFWTTATSERFVIFWRPATLHLALAFLAALALLRGMPWRGLLALSPIVFNTVSLVPLIAAQDFRYQFPIVLVTPLLSVFFIGVMAESFEESSAPKQPQSAPA